MGHYKVLEFFGLVRWMPLAQVGDTISPGETLKDLVSTPGGSAICLLILTDLAAVSPPYSIPTAPDRDHALLDKLHDTELSMPFGMPIIRIRSYITLFIVMIDHLWWDIDDHRSGE